MTISKALSAGLIDGTGAITPANVAVSTNNLTVGSSLYVVANGNVGLNTSTPGSLLDVNGSSFYRGNLNLLSGTTAYFYNPAGNAFGYLNLDSDNKLNLFNNAGSALTLSTTGSERMRISSSGDVQIGNLTDGGNTLRYFDIQNANTGSSAGAIIRLITANSSGGSLNTVDMVKYKNGSFYLNNNDGAGTISLSTAGSTRLFISANGNVGIGNTSPAQKLSVEGDIKSNGGAVISSVTGSGEAQIQFNSSLSNVYIFNSSIGNAFGIYDGTNAQHRLYYDRVNHYWNFYTGAYERMRLDVSGNLGLNESTVNSRLVIKGVNGYWTHINSGNATVDGSLPWLAVWNGNSPSTSTFGWAWYDSDNDGSLNLYRRSNSTTGSLVMSMNRSSGMVTLGAGQLKFPATQNASTDANVLDDYEEGTWTPTVWNHSTGTLMVLNTDYNFDSAPTYVKVGKLVHCAFRLRDLRASKTQVRFTIPFNMLVGDHVAGLYIPQDTTSSSDIFMWYGNLGLLRGNVAQEYKYGFFTYLADS